MRVTLHIDLPEPDEILNSGCPVPIARKGEKWETFCLGEMRKQKGVYVIHHNRKIIYIGKTDGVSMNYGMRLRREFQENAAQGKHIFPKLSSLTTPPEIKVCFFPILEIMKRMQFEKHVYRPDQMIGTFEIAMINYLEPELQQHFFRAVGKTIETFMNQQSGHKPLTQQERDEFAAIIRNTVKEHHSRKPIQDSFIPAERVTPPTE